MLTAELKVLLKVNVIVVLKLYILQYISKKPLKNGDKAIKGNILNLN